jgi:hypothetical protein
LEVIAKAIRLGTLALMRPVTTLTDGRCVARTRWIPTGARLLSELDDGLLDLPAFLQDQVGQFVDDHDHILHGLAVVFGSVGVVGRNVALRRAGTGQDLVALLHQVDHPGQH